MTSARPQLKLVATWHGRRGEEHRHLLTLGPRGDIALIDGQPPAKHATILQMLRDGWRLEKTV
jgi:hypothetical protein